MDCEKARELMLEFVEGTLSPRQAEEVKAHVESCPECMRELEDQSSRTRALQALGRVRAPDQWEEISRAIDEPGARVRPGGWKGWIRRWWPALVVLAIVAAAVVIFTQL